MKLKEEPEAKNKWEQNREKKRIDALTLKDNLTHEESQAWLLPHQFLISVFQLMNKCNLSIFAVRVSAPY